MISWRSCWGSSNQSGMEYIEAFNTRFEVKSVYRRCTSYFRFLGNGKVTLYASLTQRIGSFRREILVPFFVASHFLAPQQPLNLFVFPRAAKPFLPIPRVPMPAGSFRSLHNCDLQLAGPGSLPTEPFFRLLQWQAASPQPGIDIVLLPSLGQHNMPVGSEASRCSGFSAFGAAFFGLQSMGRQHNNSWNKSR